MSILSFIHVKKSTEARGFHPGAELNDISSQLYWGNCWILEYFLINTFNGILKLFFLFV